MDPDYRLFAAILDSGSLSAAGRALGISSAMASKRLARLEARLGARLIHRTTRRLAPTDLGARFHADVVAILRSVQEAEARVTGTRGAPSGPLRVSAPTSFGRLHVAPHMADFLETFPGVVLELDLSDDFVDIVADRIDVAIRIAPDIAPSFAAHRLATNRRVLCAAPAYLDRHGEPRTVAALRDHRLLAATGQLPWRLHDGRRRATVDGVSHVRTNSSEIVRELAVTGAGIALRSLWDVDAALVDGRLRRVLAPWEGPPDLGIYAVHPRSPIAMPAVDALVAFLRERLSPEPWGEPRP